VTSGATEIARLRGTSPQAEILEDPHLRAFFECWLDTFLFKGRIDPRLRQCAILRVLWRCGRAFEWGNHYRLARRVGLSDEDVLALRTPHPERDLAGSESLVVRAADEVVDRGSLSAATLAECRALFPEPALLQEFLYLVAGYRMFASVSASTERVAEGEVWPPDGVGPSPS